MTRFHITVIIAVLLGALALIWGNFIMLGGVVAALLIVIGLGVAFPWISLFGPFVCRGASLRRCAALTFDDGPDERSTPALLELLRKANVKAAFFCVGKQVEANPELTARIVREGHLLGNHSYGHSNFTNFFSSTRLEAELTQTQAAIRKVTGVSPTLFRPPMGLSNPRVFRVAQSLGLQVIGWSARGLDTQTTNSKGIAARIGRQIKPGAIILLHDGNIPAERLVETVKLLLVKLKESGYEVVRLDKMLK